MMKFIFAQNLLIAVYYLLIASITYVSFAFKYLFQLFTHQHKVIAIETYVFQAGAAPASRLGGGVWES